MNEISIAKYKGEFNQYSSSLWLWFMVAEFMYDVIVCYIGLEIGVAGLCTCVHGRGATSDHSHRLFQSICIRIDNPRDWTMLFQMTHRGSPQFLSGRDNTFTGSLKSNMHQ